MITKEVLEDACRKSGMKPASREHVQGHDIFIAEGFALLPGVAFQRFGIKPETFPHGCYCAIWWVAQDETIQVGRPMFFDPDHDSEYDSATRRQSRINRAMADALGFLTIRKRIRLNA